MALSKEPLDRTDDIETLYKDLTPVRRASDGAIPTKEDVLNPFYNSPERSGYGIFFQISTEELPLDHEKYPGATIVTYTDITLTSKVLYKFIIDPDTGTVYLLETIYQADGNAGRVILGPSEI